MFDIVAANQHKLPLPIQAERIDEPESRLPGSSTRYAQPMSEGQPVNNREHDEGGDAANGKQSDLENPVVRERKVIQPLHAQSNTSAAERRTNRSSIRQPNDGLAGAREARSGAAQ
jgi:hypothetical protein